MFACGEITTVCQDSVVPDEIGRNPCVREVSKVISDLTDFEMKAAGKRL